MPHWTRPLNPQDEADIQSALSIFHQAFVDAWSEDRLRQVLAQQSIQAFLAGSSDTVAACLIEHRFRSGRRIVSVGVLQDSMGLGYGTSLIKETQRRVLRSPSQHGVSAYIPADNEPALRCFQKAGFQALLTVSAYYDGRPAVLMNWSREAPCDRDSSAAQSLRIV